MQVNNKAGKYTVNWRYGNPILEHLLDEKNISVEEARKMKKADLRKALNLEVLPLPTMVTCTIVNETGDETFSHTLELEDGQRYNKEAMRKSAMATVLQAMYPGLEGKVERRVFFQAYIARKAPNGLKKFFKLFKKYENELTELSELTEKDELTLENAN